MTVSPELIERITDDIHRALGGRLEAPHADSHTRFPKDDSFKACRGCQTQGHCVTVCTPEATTLLGLGASRISSTPGIGQVDQRTARMIDHTLLKPDATEAQLETLCREAVQYGFMSVCINSSWVPLCARLLQGHAPKVCTVIGFPLGAVFSEVKAFEATLAIERGATEVDLVIAVGALKSKNYDYVEADIRAVVQAASGRALVKVILETALLSDEEKILGCELARRAGADFVKTSTGFSTGGATAGDIALMRRVVGEEMGVKASGGVREAKDAQLMLLAGANRIGASASVKIVTGGKAEGGY